jgi:hypothetical protein
VKLDDWSHADSQEEPWEKSSILSTDERQIAISLLECLRDELFMPPRLGDDKALASASSIRGLCSDTALMTGGGLGSEGRQRVALAAPADRTGA